jgi:hypothetical protein
MTLRLNSLEAQFITDWFVYHMPMAQRMQLMAEHPILYNKLMGDEIMESRQRNDGTRMPYTSINKEYSHYRSQDQ